MSRSLQGAIRLLAALLLFPTPALAQGDIAEVEFYDPPVVREAAADVLDGPEFRNLPKLDLGPNGERTKPLEKEPDKPDESPMTVPPVDLNPLAALFGGAVSMTVVVALAVILGAIIALVVLGLRRWERTEKRLTEPDADTASDDEPDALVSPGDRPSDAWLAAARAAAAAGRFDEALAMLLLGAMGHAERAGLIRPRRGLTYRDYLRSVPDSSAWHPTLDRLIRAYAPVGFGRRAATAEAFEAVVGPYETALAIEPTPGSPSSGTHSAG